MIKRYILSIFGPVVVAVLNGYISNYYFFRWGYDNRNGISILLFSLSVAGCIYVIISNTNTLKSKIWFIIPTALILINVFVIYSIYSLSSFGF